MSPADSAAHGRVPSNAARRVTLRPAAPWEADRLTALALRSKACWGHGDDFMAACRAELTVSAREIRDGPARYVIAGRGARVVGFRALAPGSCAGDHELEALFVEPAHLGTGVGRALLRHALAAAEAGGGRHLVIQGDPHAAGFYRAAGGVPAGSRESASVPGRHLPLFTIAIGPGA